MVPEEENRHPSLTVPPAAWAERTIAGMAIGVVKAVTPSPVACRNERRENLVMNPYPSCKYDPISDHRLRVGNAK
jgi:hypothetical protein